MTFFYFFSRAGWIKWLLRFYPPFLLQRIVVSDFDNNFTGCKVKVSKSLFNRNSHGSIFGGTLSSSIDPFFPILYWQFFHANNKKVNAWSKEINIKFIRAARTDVHLNFVIDPSIYRQAENALNNFGKFEYWHEVDAIDDTSNLIAKGRILVHIKYK